MKLSYHDGLLARQSTSKLCSALATLRHCQGVYANHYMATTTDNQHKNYIKAHFCQGVSPTPGRKKRLGTTHVVPNHWYSYNWNYSACASSAAGASVAGASTAGAAAALFLERRVRVAFLAVLAMFSL